MRSPIGCASRMNICRCPTISPHRRRQRFDRQDQLSQCLPRALGELSEADRLAITLCDIEGRPQRELAERLGISLSGAKSRVQRARQRLKAKIEVGCQVRYDAGGEVAGFIPRPPLAPS